MSVTAQSVDDFERFFIIQCTIVMAAFAARIFGLGRSALGTGGGRAATCGEAASADKSFGDGREVEGITTGGVSPSVGLLRGTGRGVLIEFGENADIIACRCIGVHIECEEEKCEARSRDAC